MLRTLLLSDSALLRDLALLILRLSVGLLMLTHGIPKLTGFTQIVSEGGFIPVFGSVALGLGLTVMAEVFMSVFLAIGLFTRFSLVPLIVTMLVAVFVAHASDPLSVKEHALLFLFPYLALMLTGPGRLSVDHLLFKRPFSRKRA